MSKTILIVEDDELVRGSLARVLQDKGFTVVEAANGKEGLDKASGVDLVVTDIRMPEMDGLRLVEALRGAEKTKQLPVIVLTNDEKTDSMNKALEAGVTIYLSKTTVDAETIADQIAAAL